MHKRTNMHTHAHICTHQRKLPSGSQSSIIELPRSKLFVSFEEYNEVGKVPSPSNLEHRF